ncbi:hypothetical protein SAY86_026197 [Trapa natans]|uniref:Cyclin-dependent kinase inhibitor domain-containing protein n=1 Tax=Trapa natans TaxID=22666 RepID=A0AAN7QEC3_TRANT|nr:hypothetical protein SAY86_026197 [Trapa natans]
MSRCGVSAAVAVTDAVAVGQTARGQASTTASSTSATLSAGRVRRKKTGVGEREPLMRSSNDSACTQLMSSTRCRNIACSMPVPIAVAESLRIMSTSSEDQASVSCWSSYGSNETGKEKLRFADLEVTLWRGHVQVELRADSNCSNLLHELLFKRPCSEILVFLFLQEDCSEADSSETCFNHERSEKTPSSEVAEEEKPETMNLSEAKEMEPNPLRRLQDSQSSSLNAVLDGLSSKLGKPAAKRPSDFEIEEFFAAAEAENILELEHFKNKYNFDFVKEKPLKGRFKWHQISPAEKVGK